MPIPPRRPSEKDTFHNLAFVLTKDIFDVFLIQIKLTELSLSEGGGGWKKTFKSFPFKILSPHREFTSVSLSDLLGKFKGPPRKQIPLQL
jgi:hypothetical protein